MSFLLVLSATVHPNGMTYLAESDADARRGQYLATLGRYLRCAHPLLTGICLIENSGADLGPFRSLVASENRHGRQVELVGLSLNDFPRELGKGYGEFMMLDEGLARSRLAPACAHLVKVTGRLYVKNLGAILAALPPAFDVAADVQPAAGDLASGTVDTRLVVFARQFYEDRVRGLYRQMNDARLYFAEHALYHLLRDSPGATVVPRLPREPAWVGRSGSTGQAYDDVRAKLKYPLKALRRAAHRLTGYPDLGAVWSGRGGQSSHG